MFSVTCRWWIWPLDPAPTAAVAQVLAGRMSFRVAVCNLLLSLPLQQAWYRPSPYCKHRQMTAKYSEMAGREGQRSVHNIHQQEKRGKTYCYSAQQQLIHNAVEVFAIRICIQHLTEVIQDCHCRDHRGYELQVTF